MRIYSICLLFLFCIVNLSFAEFSAKGGSKNIPFVIQPAINTGLDKIFVYDILQNAEIHFEIENPETWTWYKFKESPSDAVKISEQLISVEGNTSILKSIDLDFGYFVQSATGTKRMIYVVDYDDIAYKSVNFVNNNNSCSEVILNLNADYKELSYFTASGQKRTIPREILVKWNTSEWDAQSSTYVIKQMSQAFDDLNSNLVLPAPLTDTYFSFSGDQVADFFGSETTFSSDLYKAVAVKTNAKAAVVERENLNETGKTSGELSGSAPLDVSFISNSNDAVTLTEWYIYKPNDNSGSFLRFTDQNLNYSFKEFGTYIVKHYVSSSVCKDSAVFNIRVSDSFLDCPNFFTPRSSPGENDEFRVAYRSIISFKGVIVNRWGNTIFQWNDPAKGWDGTFKGKPVSPGVYFYVIQAKGSDGIDYLKRGDINLLE